MYAATDVNSLFYKKKKNLFNIHNLNALWGSSKSTDFI